MLSPNVIQEDLLYKKHNGDIGTGGKIISDEMTDKVIIEIEGVLMEKEIKIIEISKGVYQIEAGRKAVVIPAKSRQEALKKACRYLGVYCNEIIANSSLKAVR